MNKITIMATDATSGNMQVTEEFRTNRSENEVRNFLENAFDNARVTVFRENGGIIAIIDPMGEHESIKLSALSM